MDRNDIPQRRRWRQLHSPTELTSGLRNIVGRWLQGNDLIYVARVRTGFVPASRRQVFEKIRHLVSPTMPFANLPDTHKARWGDELTAEKMKERVWLWPKPFAQIEFLEWTGDRLRHSKFVGLRDDIRTLVEL